MFERNQPVFSKRFESNRSKRSNLNFRIKDFDFKHCICFYYEYRSWVSWLAISRTSYTKYQVFWLDHGVECRCLLELADCFQYWLASTELERPSQGWNGYRNKTESAHEAGHGGLRKLSCSSSVLGLEHWRDLSITSLALGKPLNYPRSPF